MLVLKRFIFFFFRLSIASIERLYRLVLLIFERETRS